MKISIMILFIFFIHLFAYSSPVENMQENRITHLQNYSIIEVINCDEEIEYFGWIDEDEEMQDGYEE